jgi:zinc D-Ala-D-Ala carboxypeptidase
VKGSIIALMLGTVFAAACIGLWVTWDSTKAETTQPTLDATDLALQVPATMPSPTTTTAAPSRCAVADEPVVGDPSEDWATVVVDTERRLPEDFVPPDLVSVREAGFDSNEQVRRIVIDDLAALRTDAETRGTPIVLVSAYRSFLYQQTLYEQRANDEGEAAAQLHIARAGHSEHQLGTTVDVVDPTDTELTTAFADTPAGQWVAAHAHEYGFVLSYPSESRTRTCYEFEPWHLRYVGRDTAAAIADSGLTPREWMLAREADG